MNRHEAYKLLSETLESYRRLPFPELESFVGQKRYERACSEAGDEFLLEVTIEWADFAARRLRITASADSPSTFRMERLKEEIIVAERAS